MSWDWSMNYDERDKYNQIRKAPEGTWGKEWADNRIQWWIHEHPNASRAEIQREYEYQRMNGGR